MSCQEEERLPAEPHPPLGGAAAAVSVRVNGAVGKVVVVVVIVVEEEEEGKEEEVDSDRV